MDNIEKEESVDVQKTLLNLKRNLKTIIFIAFLVTLLTGISLYFVPPVYSSNISIAFSDEKTSKFTTIIPDKFAQYSGSEKELETVKLTLTTKKFINSVIKDLNITQRYYFERNYRKNEVYDFKNLRISLDIHDEVYVQNTKETLYGKFFKITPIDKKEFFLTIDGLDYKKKLRFNEEISEEFFNISVFNIGKLTESSYFVKATNKDLLAGQILDNLKVTVLTMNVMEVVYEDTVARKAKELVEQIGIKFIEHMLEKKSGELLQTLKFLDVEIAEVQQVLKNEGEELKRYQKENKAFLPIESNIALADTLSLKEEEIKELELQQIELKNFKKALNSNKFNTIALLSSGIEISSILPLIRLFRDEELELSDMELQQSNIRNPIGNNQQLSQLITQLNMKEKLLSELNFNFTEGHPQVLRASEEVDKLQVNIMNYIDRDISRLKTNLILTKNKIIHNIVMTQNNIRAKLKIAKEYVSKKRKLLASLPEQGLAIQSLKRSFSLSEDMYTFLSKKRMEVETSIASIVSNTQIIEDATIALKPLKPKKKLIILISMVIGLILGVLYSVLRTMFDVKIRSISMIKELTDIPLYGVLPNKSNKRLFDESLRNIRTNLEFIVGAKSTCVTVLISSTIAGEGKTTVTAALAEMISKAGKKVLVMDLDLRKPRLNLELNKPNTNGMTQYLIGDLHYAESIQNLSEYLDFFSAGTVPPNPSELLLSDKFSELISELMDMYDYILFDTAPIGSVVDANMLLKYSDILLLLVEANVSEKEYLRNFNRLIEEKNVKSAGIIINKLKLLKSNQHEYGYGYGYDYGEPYK